MNIRACTMCRGVVGICLVSLMPHLLTGPADWRLLVGFVTLPSKRLHQHRFRSRSAAMLTDAEVRASIALQAEPGEQARLGKPQLLSGTPWLAGCWQWHSLCVCATSPALRRRATKAASGCHYSST